MCTVLIAEKEALVNHWLKTELGRMGHQIAGVALSSESAVMMAIESKPDVILMNSFLDGMYDGIEASGKIRKEIDVPIIFTTSSVAGDYMGRMTMARPAGILFKPFREYDLCAALELALQKKADERTLRERVEFMQQMLETIPRALFIIDGSRRIIAWSALAETMFGYGAADMTGKNADTVTTGTTKAFFHQLVERILDSDGSDTLLNDLVIECIKMDGTPFRLEISLASWELRGEMRVIFIAREVPINKGRTVWDSSHSSSLYRIFLKTVDNRMKNIIDIIEKMTKAELDITRGSDFTSVLRDCNNCVLTASIMCGGLIQEGSRMKINAYKYMSTLLKQLFSVYGDPYALYKLEIDIENSELDLLPAIYHGLIMYELVHNCIRHAFPAGMKGTINIGFGKAGGNRHCLVVRDNGTGLTGGFEAHYPDTFGLRFVSVLTRMMNSWLEFSGDGKTEFRITL